MIMIIGWEHDIGWVTGLISFSKSEATVESTVSNQQALLHPPVKRALVSLTPDDRSHFQVISSSESRQANIQRTRGFWQKYHRFCGGLDLRKWASMHSSFDPFARRPARQTESGLLLGVGDSDPFGQLLVSSQPNTRSMTKGF